MRRAARALALVVAPLCAAQATRAPAHAAKLLAPRFFPGWQAYHVFDPFVLLDRRTGKYTMYYSGSATAQMNDSVWDTWATGVAWSVDLTTWTFPEDYRPVLRPRPFHQGEVVDAQRLSSEFDSAAAYGVSALADASGVRLWYTGWSGDVLALADGRTRKVNQRIGLATSSDGVAFAKLTGVAGLGAVLGPGAPGDPDAKGVAYPSVLRLQDGSYRMWYEADDGATWRIASATSDDGQTWTRRGVVLAPETAGLDELGARRPVVIRRGGAYELWYQGRSRSAPESHVLRATSTDGIAWTKRPGEVRLHVDPPRQGPEDLYVHSVLVESDGRCRVFFARQETTVRAAAFGDVSFRSFHLFVETVTP